LRRADIVILSRAEMATPDEREAIRRRAAQLAPQAAWAEVTHAPRSLVSAAGHESALESLRGQRVAAFCGLGNPSGFRHTLECVGYQVVDFREFPDHYAYQRTDIENLATWASRLDVAAVVCTRKDLVKIGLEQLGGCPLFALAIGIEFLAGQPDLEAKVRPLVRLR
jgi:tetraacyldisaccharide 4'-kinase